MAGRTYGDTAVGYKAPSATKKPKPPPALTGRGSIEVEGLKKLRARLKKFDEVETLAAIKAANVEAGQLLVDVAKPQMISAGPVSRKIAKTLKSTNLVGSAKVNLGSSNLPFAWGVEFGAKQFPQFKPWRGNGEGAGYFLFPALRENSQEIIDIYTRKLDEALRLTFPGGSSTI